MSAIIEAFRGKTPVVSCWENTFGRWTCEMYTEVEGVECYESAEADTHDAAYAACLTRWNVTATEAAPSPAPRQPEDRKDAPGTEPDLRHMRGAYGDFRHPSKVEPVSLPTGPEAPEEGTPGADLDRTTGTATAAASQAVRPGEGEHSPLPWAIRRDVYAVVDANGNPVLGPAHKTFGRLSEEWDRLEADLDLTVSRVNSHGALVAENEALRAGIEKAQQWLDKGSLAYEALDDALLVRAESPAGRHE